MPPGGGQEQAAGLDLLLVRWLCSKFHVQLGLAGLALLPEFLNIYSGAPGKGKHCPGCVSLLASGTGARES